MKVKDLMVEGPLLTVGEDDDVALASQMMLWAAVRHLPVIRDGVVVGVLSERDVLRVEARAEGARAGARESVKQVMSSPAVTAGPEMDIREAAALMLDRGVACLPVTERGRLLGIVTTTDVLGSLAQRRAVIPTEGWPRVAHVMTSAPQALHEDDDILEAVARMTARGIRHLPVVDAEGRILGMLSDRDVRGAVGDPLQFREATEEGGPVGPSATRVGHAMTRPAYVIGPEEPLASAVRRLLDWRIGALAVVDDERLVGILSYVDVLDAIFHRLYERPAPSPGESRPAP